MYYPWTLPRYKAAAVHIILLRSVGQHRAAVLASNWYICLSHPDCHFGTRDDVRCWEDVHTYMDGFQLRDEALADYYTK